jgi:hypothetical protein
MKVTSPTSSASWSASGTRSSISMRRNITASVQCREGAPDGSLWRPFCLVGSSRLTRRSNRAGHREELPDALDALELMQAGHQIVHIRVRGDGQDTQLRPAMADVGALGILLDHTAVKPREARSVGH